MNLNDLASLSISRLEMSEYKTDEEEKAREFFFMMVVNMCMRASGRRGGMGVISVREGNLNYNKKKEKQLPRKAIKEA